MDKIKKNPIKTRLKISSNTMQFLAPLLKQFEDEFSGMIKGKKDDVIDIILSLRGYALTEKEIVEIRKKKFTALQRAKWLLNQVAKNELSGDEVDFDALMKQIRAPSKPKKEKNKLKKAPSKEGVLSIENVTKE